VITKGERGAGGFERGIGVGDKAVEVSVGGEKVLASSHLKGNI
jgi:hypothetical protein